MTKIKKLIKCDKCGSTGVVVETPPQKTEVIIESMDEYIEKNKQKSPFSISGTMVFNTKTTLNLRCIDCGFIRSFEQTTQPFTYTYG